MAIDKKHVEYKALPEWYETGHINTTLIIANLAGLEEQLAKEISIYCQLPDYYKLTYSAGTPLWAWIAGKGRDAKLISTLLHGFHGGDPGEVKRRQRKFRDIVRAQMVAGEEVWKIGFTVHAFGDSYAHTFVDEDGGRKAYGYPLGHGLDFLFCVKPDYTSKHPKLYMEYCAELFFALSGNAPEESNSFCAFRDDFQRLISEETYLNCSTPEQEYITSDFIITRSLDKTTNAQMNAHGDRLVYDDVIAYLGTLELMMASV